jgi:hypothetical protein
VGSLRVLYIGFLCKSKALLLNWNFSSDKITL